MTEAAPTCTFEVRPGTRSGYLGLPVPGVDAKLAPCDGKLEIRFRGPNLTPGYWRAPEQTADAFDDEGYYRTGDAVAWIDAADPQRGLRFDGRIAEDFKLATGTFVSVGPLRARVIADGAPYVQDAVVTGLNRDEVGLLVFPRIDDCRRLAALAPDAGVTDVLRAPAVRAFFQQLVNRLWQAGTGSASRVACLTLLAEPPAIDRGELTDKGSINQRAVLAQRGALIDAMHDGHHPDTLRPTIAK
jgi:feruloyl-CoA synthase